MKSKFLVTPLLLFFVSSCTPFKKWSGDASVRTSGDLPCFAIDDNEFTRLGLAKLEDIQIIGGNGDMWYVNYSQPAKILPDQCTPYGKPVGIYSEMVAAKSLQPGEVYEVVIGAPMDGYPYEVQFYAAYFCISANTHGYGHIMLLKNPDEISFNEVCR